MSFNHSHLPPEIQSFINKFSEQDKVEILNYERYENIYEVEYRTKNNRSRTVYIRAVKDRMSDSDLSKS